MSHTNYGQGAVLGGEKQYGDHTVPAYSGYGQAAREAEMVEKQQVQRVRRDGSLDEKLQALDKLTDSLHESISRLQARLIAVRPDIDQNAAIGQRESTKAPYISPLAQKVGLLGDSVANAINRLNALESEIDL